MSPDLPSPRLPKLATPAADPAPGSVGRLDALLVILSAADPRFRGLPDGPRLAREATRRRALQAGNVFAGHLPSARGTPVFIGFLGQGATTYDTLVLARKLVAATRGLLPRRLGICADGPGAGAARRALLAAALAAAQPLPAFRSKPEPEPELDEIRVFQGGDLDTAECLAEAEGNGLARWLTCMPPNMLDPTGYRRLLEALAAREGWGMEILDRERLAELGAGAFLAVARGSGEDDAALLRLTYRPGKGRRPRLALVGKGIVFDTGGTNLKPFRGMLDMHGDMQGSGVAVGTLLALTRLRWPDAVDCWLPVTANRTGPEAYTSRDVVAAANGTRIEVVHTDAEGRMVLADALVLAGRESPELIIDYATLTGACVAALTTRYSGVFSNRRDWHDALVNAGRRSGERVWPFPLDADFDEDLKSQVADVLQCSVDNDGDHIHAARFLSSFVPDTCDWVHLDLSAGHRKGGLAHVPSAFTGFGVRFTLELLRRGELPPRTS